jgi:glycosidase
VFVRATLCLFFILFLAACPKPPEPPPPPQAKPQPAWKDSILYFTFIDRFANGDPSNDGPVGAPAVAATDFQGGDWAGVRQKLEEGYFEDLGVNALWLSTPLDNPSKMHGDAQETHWYTAYHAYWPDRLDQTEEHFGTLEELKGLVDAAHFRGMNVIIDYPINHVYIDSPVYKEHPEWFWPLEQTYNGQTKKCLCGQACSWDDEPERKRCWFTEYLPDYNFTVKAARDATIDNIISWVKKTGVDGLRLDALKHVEDSFILELRQRLKQDIDPQRSQPFLLLGETFSGDRELLRYYVDPQRMLDGQFDFALRAPIVGAVMMRTLRFQNMEFPMTMRDLDDFLLSNANYYGEGLMSNFLGNHDVPRAIHFAEDRPRWGSPWELGFDQTWTSPPALPPGNPAFERLANAFTVLFSLPGIPLIYYGDEIGMAGAGDPDNRRMMDFDTGNYTEGQRLLREHVRKLAHLRQARPALRRGQRVSLSAGDDTLAYQMQHAEGSVYVLINRADVANPVSGLPAGNYEDLLTQQQVTGPQVQLPPRSSMILVAKP